MKKNYLNCLMLAVFLLWGAIVARAQQNFFEPVSSTRIGANPGITKNIKKLTFYNLKTTDLRTFLAKAPVEFVGKTAPVKLQIPLPNGNVETFDMLESQVLAPEIAAQNPAIKTYVGRGTTHKNYTISMSFTAAGFNAIILGVDGDAVYVDKVSKDSADRLYMTYFGRDAKKPIKVKAFGPGNKCGSVDLNSPAFPNLTKGARQQAARNNTGSVIRTFRLAVAADGEFTHLPAYNGNVDLAFAGVVAYVTRLSAVYRAELSIKFVLVSGKTVVYASTTNDPYTNDDQTKQLEENQANLDAIVGNSNYDIGHVLGTQLGSGGGIAARGSVCDNETKGQGVSGVGDGSYAPIFDDQLIAHEIGHQFNMSHSYNSIIPVCTTRRPETSVEPGAGATIMSYGFTCDDDANDDNYENTYQPFLNFHSTNFEQAEAFIASLSCYTTTGFENQVPVITMPSNRTIPKSTPFSLAGSATDDDADLTYSWEGMNIGTMVPTTATLADKAQPPFFRSYEPISTSTRIYPRLEAILNGSNYAKGDKLPSVGIATTHRLTVRDGYGGVAYKELTVTVAGNSGPFLETTNLSGTYPGNSTKTITWSVNNTTAAPVSCASVNILLSIDGGQSFTYTLISNTPNDGSQSVTLPNVSTNQARIKIVPTNNIFFDISNSDFTIQGPQVVPIVGLSAPDSIATEGATTGGGARMSAPLATKNLNLKSRTIQFSKYTVLKGNQNGRMAAEDPEDDYAIFHFERSFAGSKLTTYYEITGSAVGDDFLTFADTVSFEMNELAFDLYVYPGTDLLTEGDETLTLTLVDKPTYDVHPTDTDATIYIKDATTVTGNFDGHLYGADCDTFRGWVWDTKKPNAVITVDILDGNNVIATIPAGEFRQDLKDAGKGDGKHYFRFVIPESLKDNQPHSLRARVTGNGFMLKSGPKVINCQPLAPIPPAPIGPLVAQVGVPYNSGALAVFTDPQGGALTYNLTGLLNGLNFNTSTRVISGTPAVAGSSALTYSATDPTSRTTTMNIDLTVNPAAVVTGNFEGFLDKVECGTIRGWIYDKNAPNAPVTIEFYTGSTVWGSTVANIFRQDLKDAGKGNGVHAYSFVTPPSLKGTGNHSISARVQNGTYILKQSGKDLNCPSPTRLAADQTGEFTVSLLGNPISNQLQVEVRGGEGQQVRFVLSDVSGRAVSEHQVEQTTLVERHLIPVGKAPTGLLFLRTFSGSRSVVLKVIKQ
jgi:hypothetical protein